MEEQPITPLTGPVLDADGRLTYVGVDGRRYVVVESLDLDPASSIELMEELRQSSPLFQQIELLSEDWLNRVCEAGLSRDEALSLLLATLETALEGDEGQETDQLEDKPP